jgi:hypothetical protein
LLAEPGPEAGPHAPQAIYDTHPSGAAFRRAAERVGYRVHQASYGSLVGERIDLFDWIPTFSTNMDRVLRTRFQDELLPEGKRNRVVMFETCFNSNWFREQGEEPGRASGPELTVANGKAVFRELRSIFERHPDVLFVHLTATPLAPRLKGEALWKAAARFAAGKPSQQANLARAAELSREFNTWLADPEGWLAGYPLKNIAVFDYYDVMTGHGRTDALLYPADGAGYDAHPGPEGQRAAADALLPFLNRAVRRAGVDGAAR